MTRKRTRPVTHVIQFRNVIMWPVIPILRDGVNLARQTTGQLTANVVVLPVIRIEHKRATRRKRTNWMDSIHLKPVDIGVVRATMKAQRYDARYEQAQERLKEIFSNPA